jgi:hypothetical protein
VGFRGGIAPGYGGALDATVAPLAGTTQMLAAFPQGAYRLHSLGVNGTAAPAILQVVTLAGYFDVAEIPTGSSFILLDGYLAFGTVQVTVTTGGGVVYLNYDIVTTPRVS